MELILPEVKTVVLNRVIKKAKIVAEIPIFRATTRSKSTQHEQQSSRKHLKKKSVWSEEFFIFLREPRFCMFQLSPLKKQDNE